MRLVSHDVGGVTSRDLDLARRISEIAAELDVAAAPAETAALEIALDVPAPEDVSDFWAAVLGYETAVTATQVEDPGGRRTALWFQDSDSARGRRRSASTTTSSSRSRWPRSGSMPPSPPAARS